MKLELKKRIVKTPIGSTVLYAAETWTLKSGHSRARIVWNVDLEKVNEIQLDWTPIQLRGFRHGGWKQKLDEHHLTKTEKLVRSCVEKWIPSVYSLRRQNGRDKNLWETECYDDRLDEEQRRGIWSYKELDREDWHHWRLGPAWKGRAHEREKEREIVSPETATKELVLSYNTINIR